MMHAQKISHEAITGLLAADANPAVTMYIPMETTAAPPHITENQIRFKNLVHKAGEMLKERGDDSGLSMELSNLLDTYYNDMDFWRDQGRALLICAVPGDIRMFCLPVDSEEYVAVDDNFHLAPVLALLGDAREYYVLALAQQNPKVFLGDMYGLGIVDAGLPTTMREALGIDEPNQKSENQGSATGSSLNTGWFNGRGGARDPQNIDRLRFFHLIDKLLHDKLDRSLPMIVAGVEAEIAEFRELSKYPKILAGSISGNHTETRTNDLFDKARAIVMTELIKPDHEAAREEYERVSGTNPDRVAHDKSAILQAADQGRIDKLLAMMSRHTTDTVQDKVESVFRITFPDGDHSRTLNNLAAKVWQMSGRVISLLPSEMPNGAPMVARLRY